MQKSEIMAALAASAVLALATGCNEPAPVSEGPARATRPESIRDEAQKGLIQATLHVEGMT